MAEQPYKYWAFISYSHQDRAWANWLHKSLETYRVPHRLVGREHWSGDIPRRLMPIFRDRDELPSSAELGSVLNEALQQSRYLIVICSPQSARSRWVNEEVKYFKSLGRSQRVLPLIIGGEPGASEMPNSGLAECLPPAIRFEVDASGELTERKAEPIAADARGGKDGRATAKLKLIAGLLSVGLDELKQRERQRQILQRIFGTVAAITLALLAGSGWHWQQNEKQHALQAQELKVRIAQLYENGRQELLAHNEARAAVYLNEAYKLGVNTPALRYMLGRTMRVVDAQLLRVQMGSQAWSVDISPDGKRFLTVDKDSRLTVWDSASGVKLGSYDIGESNEFYTANFSPKGTLIWIASDHSNAPAHRLRVLSSDAKQIVADFSRGGVVTSSMPIPIDKDDQRIIYLKKDLSIATYSLRTHREFNISGQYSSARFCSDRHSIVAGTRDGKAILLNRDTGAQIKIFTGPSSAVIALDFSEDCKILAAGTISGAVRVWNVESGEVQMSSGHAQEITELKMNPQGTRLMSLTRGGVNVWNGKTGALFYAGKFLDPLVSMAAMSADGERLASVSNSRLSLTAPRNAAELYTLDGHQGTAISFGFSADSRKFISGGVDSSVVIFDLPRDALAEWHFGLSKERHVSKQWELPEAQARFNYSGSAIFVGGENGVGEIWSQDATHKIVTLPGPKVPFSALAFSANDKILATGSRDQSLRLWDTATGALLKHFDHLIGTAIRLSFEPSAHYLSVALEDKGTTLISVLDGDTQVHFDTYYSRAQSFNPKGGTYAVGIHGVVKLWDLASRRYLWSMPLPFRSDGDPVVSLIQYSPQGDKILATLLPNKAFILDARTGRILQQIEEPSAAGLSVMAFSPDGQSIAFGDYGKSVQIWQLSTNTMLGLRKHMADVRAVAFSPDGALLASAAGDGVLNIWDASNGQLLESIVAHDLQMSWDGVQFSPQGDRVLTAGTDNTVKYWNMQKESRNPEQIAALLRCRVAWRAGGTTLISVRPDMQSCAKR